jgi:hypothetical protein
MSGKNSELSLFVWEEFCFGGLAFAIAETVEQAQKLIERRRVGSKCAVAQITNLTADSGEGLADSVLADALSMFPSAERPSFVVDDWGPVQQYPLTDPVAFYVSGGA